MASPSPWEKKLVTLTAPRGNTAGVHKTETTPQQRGAGGGRQVAANGHQCATGAIFVA